MIAINAAELKSLINTVYNTPAIVRTVIGIAGSSGIGKTTIVGQVAKEMGHELRILSAPHLSLEDLYIPSLVDGKLVFKLSEHFAPPKDGYGKVMILIDEITRPSSDTVSNLLMSLICERRVGAIPLSDSFSFIATYNPPGQGDYTDTRDIFADLAMSRRICRVELMFDKEAFLLHHRPTMHPLLHGFLSTQPEVILMKSEINCPRQWKNFDDDVMKSKEWKKEDHDMMTLMASTYMSTSTVIQWMQYLCNEFDRFVTAEELFSSDAAVVEAARERLRLFRDEGRLDQIETTRIDVRDWIYNAPSLTREHAVMTKEIMKCMPKAIAYMLWEEVVPGGKEKDIFPAQAIFDKYFAKEILQRLKEDPAWKEMCSSSVSV